VAILPKKFLPSPHGFRADSSDSARNRWGSVKCSWSAPSCIATGGLGWGLQIGADITDFVIVLNSEDAVCAFSLGGNVTIGGGISATAGPIGTGGSVQASLAHPAPMFSYSKSKGTYSKKFLLC
jgi:lipid-binding SYLF domain-containing protein